MVSLHFKISFVYQVIYNRYRKFYILSSFSSFSSISSFSFYPWGKNENEETEETEETEESFFLRLIDRSFWWWGTQGVGGATTGVQLDEIRSRLGGPSSGKHHHSEGDLLKTWFWGWLYIFCHLLYFCRQKARLPELKLTENPLILYKTVTGGDQ